MMKFYLALILTSVIGCYADMDFSRPAVISVNPAHNSTLVPSVSVITVKFSKSMDTVRTNNSFSLSGDSGRIDGLFLWENDGRTLTFTPRAALSPSDCYTIRITKDAEDTEGNDLKNEHVSKFYISGETISPYVLSYLPAANTTGNPVNSQIVITFSEPVDLNSIYTGISVSPSIQGYYSWNGDFTEIRFTPLYGLVYRSTYTVSVSDSVLDAAGNRLREPVTFSFTVGDDFTRPELSVYQDLAVPLNFSEAAVTHGAEKDGIIVINFTEVVNTENLRSAVTISPSAEFYITSTVFAGATAAYINFTENLQCEETYILRINSSITDPQGNTLAKDYRFVFVTDGAGSINPAVSSIGDSNGFPVWVKDDIQVLAIIPANPLLYPGIGVDFSTEINPLTLSIHVETVAGSGISPSLVNIDWPGIPFVPFTRLSFGLYNVLAGNIYKIVIKGGRNGLKDMNGNYMKDDFTQMVRF
jgi:hypothetical protein